MKRNVLILQALILLSTAVMAQDPNFHIFLCFGQSNMEGQGVIEAQDTNVDARFLSFQALDCPELNRKKETWVSALPPTCQCHSGLSPVDYFGRTMIAESPTNIKIGVINVAIGGCDIRLFDKDLYTEYDSTYTEEWFTDKISAYNGNPYQYLVNLASLAQKDGVIKGVLLHQGETNTNDVLWPSYVANIYNNLLEDLSLNAEQVPILVGELVHEDQGGICASMNTIINKLPETIPTAHVVSSSACSCKTDSIHFNSAGYRELGKRYAKKMLDIK